MITRGWIIMVRCEADVTVISLAQELLLVTKIHKDEER